MIEAAVGTQVFVDWTVHSMVLDGMSGLTWEHLHWRCWDCGTVNRPMEAFCYSCGAGPPDPDEGWPDEDSI